jgi:hypothetical protein
VGGQVGGLTAVVDDVPVVVVQAQDRHRDAH